MKYLNIELSTLRSAEYVGSSPAERGTWLSLSAYCADQENGGRVVGGMTWKDRQWQQACGITLREIRAATRLIKASGADVIVFAYPVEKEAEVKAKREVARLNGLNGGRPAIKPTSDTDEEPTLVPTSESDGKPTLQSGREEEGNGIGKEGNKTLGKPAAAAAPASDEDWLKGLAENPAYSTLDVPREFHRMRAWCAANRKEPTRRRFVNWLNRCDRPMKGGGAAGEFSGKF